MPFQDNIQEGYLKMYILKLVTPQGTSFPQVHPIFYMEHIVHSQESLGMHHGDTSW